ncbi:hypothetical protein HDU93_005952 [Gonapodya sp. JEL0774]|nr:hypothetical protein HDU93_005952 [Gonapodya sp. JEL0774]
MLSIDPTQRPSAAKLLEEPWIRSISCCAKRAAREAGFSVEDKKYMPKGLFKTGTMMPHMVPDAAEGGGDAGSGGQAPSPAQLGKPMLTRGDSFRDKVAGAMKSPAPLQRMATKMLFSHEHRYS